jgi:hypothetical protein
MRINALFTPEKLATIVAHFVDELNEGKRPTILEYLLKYPLYANELESMLETALWLKTTFASVQSPDDKITIDEKNNFPLSEHIRRYDVEN